MASSANESKTPSTFCNVLVVRQGVLQQRKPRKSGSRSKTGCSMCRQRKVKCDENVPTCGNCFRIGMDCPGPAKVPQSSKPVNLAVCLLNPSPQIQQIREQGSRDERALHWRFVQRTAPTLAIMTSDDFWNQAVLVSSQADDGIRKATLALCVLLEQPIADSPADNAIRDNKMAFAWYGQSLQTSLHNLTKSSGDILPLVLSSILYLMIEHQHGKDENANHLIRHAFDAIRTHKGAFTDVVIICIPVLLQALLASKIDSSVVPVDHSAFAVEKALPWAYKTAHPKLYMLRLQLFKIMHECQTFTDRGCDQGAYNKMLWKLQEWWLHFCNYEDDKTSKSPRTSLKLQFFCLRIWFRMTYIQLQSQMVAMYGLECPETQAQLFLGEWEATIATFGVIRQQILPAMIESTVMPKLVFLVWNTQSAHLHTRLLRARDTLAPYMAQKVLNSISYLITTIIELRRKDLASNISKIEPCEALKMRDYYRIVTKLTDGPVPMFQTLQEISSWLKAP